MRELVLRMTVSLDGFASDLQGHNAWMFGTDPQAKAWVLDTISNASLHIMGSGAFAMGAHWQTATDPFAAPMNLIPKAVFTKRGPAILQTMQTTAAAKPLQPGAESWPQAQVAAGDLAAEIAALKAQPGKPILAHGGIRFARSLIAQGLVDQFALLVAPVALGQGLPIFSDLPAPTALCLASAQAFPGGAVAKTYRLA